MIIGVLKYAIEEAENSLYHPYKIGAVIFKGSRILSSGRNSIRTCSYIHPRYKNINSLHAEQAAIIGNDWNKFKGASILVIRMNISRKLSLAYPCDMCYELISHVNIKWLHYSTRNGEIKKEKI